MSLSSHHLGIPQSYSAGVLIGNWSEDVAVQVDKMKQFKAKQEALKASRNGTMTTTLSDGTTLLSRTKPAIYDVRFLQQRVSLTPVQRDRFLRYRQPLMIKCEETCAFIAVDTNPRYSPRVNHFRLSATPVEIPQVRSTWILHKVPDPNDKFYSRENESDIVHYGQNVRLVNEYATSDGFLTISSTLRNATAQSPVTKRQEVTACLGGGSGELFTIEQSDGKGIACPMEGHPVNIGDKIVLRHKMTNCPLVCEENYRFNSTFGLEYEISAQLLKPQSTNMSVVTQPGNFFSFVYATPGSVFKPFESDITTSAIQRVKAKVLYRGTGSFISMRKAFNVLDKNKDSKLSRIEFKEGMEIYGCPLTTAELDAVFKVFDADGSGGITLSEFLLEMCSPLPESRRNLITEAFKYLNRDGYGVVTVSELNEIFKKNLPNHPEVLNGTKTEKQVLMEFMAVWDKYDREKDDRIALREFMDYYTEISASIDEDGYFEKLIRNAWNF